MSDELHDDMDVVEFVIPPGVEAVAIYDGGTVHVLTLARLRTLLERDAVLDTEYTTISEAKGEEG